MKKEYQWNVTVDGESYCVRCVPMKTVFDVYVDDELVQKVAWQGNSREDTEENIKIGGKVCQFVVYDGEPDLSVDGILQGAEAAQRRIDLRNKLLKLFGGVIMTLVSSYAAFWWYVFQAAGEPVSGGIFALIGILAFVVAGILLVVSALKKKKEYEWSTTNL